MNGACCRHKIGHDAPFLEYAAADSELTAVFHLHSLESQDVAAAHGSCLGLSIRAREYIDEAKFQQLFAADKAAADQLIKAAESHGIKSKGFDTKRNSVTLTGKISEFEAFLGIQFVIVGREGRQPFLDYLGVIRLPAEVEPHVSHISGLNPGHQGGERSRLLKPEAPLANRAAAAVPGFSPTETAAAYNFPDGDGAGQCIGFVELGGNFSESDMAGYFESFGLPVPEIEIVGDRPNSNAQVNDLEITLDLQLAGGLAPKAKLVVYYAETIVDAIKLAVTDSQNNPTVLSVSWAKGEVAVSSAERQALNYLCYQASLKGMTIVAASGDKGAWEVSSPNPVGVNFPAENPYVLACGGTRLQSEAAAPAQRQEFVWNQLSTLRDASGGGFSMVNFTPVYQATAVSRYRRYHNLPVNGAAGVPDVAANASSATPYAIFFEGNLIGAGAGTSASTPVVAAMIARINQNLGKPVGYLNEFLYKLMFSPVFNQITVGNNGLYVGFGGWNPCTGLGTLNGGNLLDAIRESEAYL